MVVARVCHVAAHVGYIGLAVATTHVITRMPLRVLVLLVVLPPLLLLSSGFQLHVHVHILN